MIIGLTGGIASGKSTVSKMLQRLGAKVIDADVIARQVVEPGQPAWREIAEHFGAQILLPDRQIDRHRLAEIVFRDERERKTLNHIVHPRVREEMERQTQEWTTDHPGAIVIWDVPLLIEGGMYRRVDKIIVVTVDEQTQLRRLMDRNGYGEAEAKRRMAAQMPLAEKAAYADFIINNSGSLKETCKQVKQIWKEIASSN